MTRFCVSVVREGVTLLDWNRSTLQLRKPRTYSLRKAKPFKFIQAKCDGHRVVAVRRNDKLHIFTTQGIDIREKCEHTAWYRSLRNKLGDSQWWDGEIYVPGRGREAVSTALAERDPDLVFGVFGTSMLTADASMHDVKKLATSHKQATPDYYECKSGEDYQAALRRVAKLGPHYDGIVLKSGMYDSWMKLKHKNTIDLVVMGLKPGKGKYVGMCGSLKGGVYVDGELIQVARVSGMDDAVRESISEKDLGRVFECEYERCGSRGGLQHPRFQYWRDDKAATDCFADQDLDLLNCLTT